MTDRDTLALERTRFENYALEDAALHDFTWDERGYYANYEVQDLYQIWRDGWRKARAEAFQQAEARLTQSEHGELTMRDIARGSDNHRIANMHSDRAHAFKEAAAAMRLLAQQPPAPAPPKQETTDDARRPQ